MTGKSMTKYCQVCHDGVIQDGACLRCGVKDEQKYEALLARLADSELQGRTGNEKYSSKMEEKLSEIAYYLRGIRGILIFLSCHVYVGASNRFSDKNQLRCNLEMIVRSALRCREPRWFS